MGAALRSTVNSVSDRALHFPSAVLSTACSLPHCTVRDRGKSPPWGRVPKLPLPQFPSKSTCIAPAPGKESPCTSLTGTRTALEHHFPHLPRQGVPPGYPLEQGIPLVSSSPPAHGSSKRVAPLTSAATPTYSTSPATLLLLTLPEHRDPQARSQADFPGAVSSACLPAGAPTWKPTAAAAAVTDTHTGRARAERTRRRIGLQLGLRRWQQITPCQ